jgi:hypothetical protein
LHSITHSEVSEPSEKPATYGFNSTRYPSMESVTKLFKKIPKPFKGKKKESRDVVVSHPTLLEGKAQSEIMFSAHASERPS